MLGILGLITGERIELSIAIMGDLTILKVQNNIASEREENIGFVMPHL